MIVKKIIKGSLGFNYPRFVHLYITVVILLFLPAILSTYGVNTLSQILIYGIFAMSLDLLIGYCGLVSLGHAAFFGVGGYAAGILIKNGLGNFWLTLAAGILTAVVIAIIFGLLLTRSSGAYFLMLTLALGQMLYAFVWQWRSFTGGDDGLPGLARPELGLPLSLWNSTNFYYFVLVFFVLASIFLFYVVNTPFGKGLMGIRESETRMKALGFNTSYYKFIAYVFSGAVAGLAGVLNAYYNGYIGPGNLSWTVSGMVMLMVIIGGAGSLYGAFLGAGVIIVLQNIMSSYTERWQLVMGLIFVICVMYMPHGIYGYLAKLFKGVGKRLNESIES